MRGVRLIKESKGMEREDIAVEAPRELAVLELRSVWSLREGITTESVD